MDNTLKSMEDFTKFSLSTFVGATSATSLTKLSEEIIELNVEIESNGTGKVSEYVDCLMCLIDSAARECISPEMLMKEFERKLAVNKNRVWLRNTNGTYSHKKSIA